MDLQENGKGPLFSETPDNDPEEDELIFDIAGILGTFIPQADESIVIITELPTGETDLHIQPPPKEAEE